MWIFGIIDRATMRFRLFLAGNDRTWEQLSAFIQFSVFTDIRVQTEIFSDGWLAYRQINTLGYNHSIVFHNRSLGHGRETTNHIENLWSRLKRLPTFTQGFKVTNVDDLEDYAGHFQ